MTRARNSALVVLTFGGFIGLSMFLVFLQPKHNAHKWREVQHQNWKGVQEGYREKHQPGGMNVWRNPFSKGDDKK